MKHTNNGNCPKCEEIFNRYHGANGDLKSWFKLLQAKHPEAHISCAGRGKKEQEEAYSRGASRAHYGQSAHNYNCAIDLFEMSGDGGNIYERPWFNSVVGPNIPNFLVWYGTPGSPFPELPHVEIKDWRTRKKELKLVE